jgi:ABC-type lipoprotein release transport system permease subunit
MGRVIAAALPGIASIHLGSVATLILVLAAVALVASSLPAVKASRIRPARVLQEE